MDAMTHYSKGAGSASIGAARVVDELDATLPGLVTACSEIIGSAISARVRGLGGDQHEVDQLARSAAFAVLAWSVNRTFGS